MSGHPQGGHYEDGYGPTQPAQGQDAYYHEEQYGQYHDDAHAQAQGHPQQPQGDAYYDES
jgi:1,3-beta-glucan synthase